MNTTQAIMTRRSVRRFLEKPLPDDAVHTILAAGMAGPSCVNARDWSFIVVTDRHMLNRMADANGRPAEPLRAAPLAVLVCGDESRAFSRAKEYWVIDASIAAQNMILAAHDMGIGSVWLGTWPQMNRVKAQKALFSLPEDQIPHSIIAFGWPDEAPAERPDTWDDSRIHMEKW